jgi:protein involved in polysaccharide export with SLBB domain
MLLLLAALAIQSPIAAQVQPTSADSLLIRLASSQRAQVTRVQLGTTLEEIERILESGGYSPALREQKRAEAALIRRRLTEGDLRPGDVIVLAVANEPDLSGPFQVTTARTIIIPAAGEIVIPPLLRAEIEEYMTEQIRRFVRDPLVRADPLVRISIFGGVGRQGFFVAPASALLSDVIMESAGGPSGSVKMDKSEIKRDDKVIVDSEAFQMAIRNGLSLDQLNIQAGDEIHVGQRRSGRLPILAVLSAVTSATFLILRIF